jgi:3-oxoacyl-[acyl-carrier-protein] synthase-3
MSVHAHVVGWGKYIPKRLLTNNDLSRLVSTSDEWIQTRTGIQERHLAEEGETTSFMAASAARRALEIAQLNPAQIDLIVVATVTPDYFFPSTACLVQDLLGANRAAAFDLFAGCTGFVYGLSVAANMISSETYHTVLVIGAETLSTITDWSDRTTCVLFGDGAGAIILQAGENEGGVLATSLGSDGSGKDILWLPAGGSQMPASQRTVRERLHFIHMNGREVFRFAVKVMHSATSEVLGEIGCSLEEISLLIPHQANQRIIDAAARSLNLPAEKVFSNVARYGNTSTASIPIALCEAAETNRIKPGDLVICVGFGAGLTWGASAIRWTRPLPVVTPFWRRVLHHFIYFLAIIRSYIRRFLRKLLALGVQENPQNNRGSRK